MEQVTPLLREEDTEHNLDTCNREDLNGSAGLPLYTTKWAGFKSRVLLPSNIYLLLPLYLQPGGRQIYSKSKDELHPTAYLDALRGYAAFIVFIYHGWRHTTLWFVQLPIIRTFFLAGPGMVSVFFVISGYVLSYKILRLIHSKQSARLLDTLSSSMFRRWLRLYGSSAAGTLIAACCIYLDWFVPDATLQQASFLGQIWHWAQVTLAFSNPFANVEGWIHPGVFYTPYLAQLWTIPVEYRGSVMLFCFCLASAKMTAKMRMIFLWIVILPCYYWRCVYVPEFLYGMFIAELSLYRFPERQARPVLPNDEKLPSRQQKLWRIFRAATSNMGSCIMLAFGILLLGQPEPPGLGFYGPFPFQYLVYLIPSWYGDAAYTFWLSIGAFLTVLALDSSPMLQKPLTWSFSQYMGDLSFGIYVLHVIWLESLYIRLLYWQVAHLGFSYLAWIPGILVVTLCVLWSADYFRRLDRLFVRSGRWLQTMTFTKWD